jgi:hypothetical protein
LFPLSGVLTTRLHPRGHRLLPDPFPLHLLKALFVGLSLIRAEYLVIEAAGLGTS